MCNTSYVLCCSSHRNAPAFGFKWQGTKVKCWVHRHVAHIVVYLYIQTVYKPYTYARFRVCRPGSTYEQKNKCKLNLRKKPFLYTVLNSRADTFIFGNRFFLVYDFI